MGYNPNFRGSSVGAARGLLTGYVNAEAFTLVKTTPVTVNALGQMVKVNVSSDSSVAGILGVAAVDTPTTATGSVMDVGRLENITTSFAIGDPVYIATDGTLINVRPDIGVSGFTAGMYVIFVGVIVKNEFNGANKDLKVYMDVIGTL